MSTVIRSTGPLGTPSSLAAGLLLVLLAPPAPAAAPAEAWRVLEELHETSLDSAAAVPLAGVTLEAGPARIDLAEGLLVPATPVAGRQVEMVFLGRGRFRLDAPDEIEAGQLELHTGGRTMDALFDEAVLVVSRDAAAQVLLGRERTGAVAAESLRQAGELLETWREGPVRRLFGVQDAIARDAWGDAPYRDYFAGWFRSRAAGEFLYSVDPDAREQLTLGRFTRFEGDSREERRLRKELHRQQERGYLAALEDEDLGVWTTWLSSSLRDPAGRPLPGRGDFEPERYEISARLTERGRRLEGSARLELRAVSSGRRAVGLGLGPDFVVERVALEPEGAELVFLRSGRRLTVFLPESVERDERLVLRVDYRGAPLRKMTGRLYSMRDPLYWYPHAGLVDRAVYELELRRPRGLDLVASGRRVAGGEEEDEVWERHVLEIPSMGVSFEVGDFRVERFPVGHVEVSLAFDRETRWVSGKVRREIRETLRESLLFLEETFGPYPLDHLSVVTVPRGFSQGILGFVTLSSPVMAAPEGAFRLGVEDRRTVIAHEVAHQWWGNLVAFRSYRDRWISEAMAGYAALRFSRERLGSPGSGRRAGPTTGWYRELTRTLEDGRTVESLGPLVLGERLYRPGEPGVYEAIVYKKGAVVLDMLGRLFRDEAAFTEALRVMVELARQSGTRLDTERFLALLGRSCGIDLGWFADRFIYGTGIPVVYYDYGFETAGEGRWRVTLRASQSATSRLRYRIVKAGETLDVRREREARMDVSASALVVPFRLSLFREERVPATAPPGDRRANAVVDGRLLLEGRETERSFEVEGEPRELVLDPARAVLGRFFRASEDSARRLLSRAQQVAGADPGEDLALLQSALDRAEHALAEGGRDPARTADAQVAPLAHLALARLHLDAGRIAEARASLEAGRASEPFRGEELLAVEADLLDARALLLGGEPEAAFRSLQRMVVSHERTDRTEAWALLAAAAAAAGHEEELARARAEARRRDVDLGPLAED